MSVDPLQYLPIEHWHKLKSVFKSDWPRSISGYTVLDTEEAIIKQGFDYGFKVYCPFGDVSNGMVAINIKRSYNEIIIQHPKDDTKDLEYALRNTKVINWKDLEPFEIAFTPKHAMKCIIPIMAEKKLRIDHLTVTKTFVLNRSSPFNVEIPSGFTFELLPLEYIKLVDSVWPHRYPSSEWYFELLTKAKLAYGLFNNKELVTWVYVKEMGALGHLYTLEQHRRKGYGELVLRLISNVLMAQGKTVFALCVVGNTKAQNVYEKLEFVHVHNVEWGTFAAQQIGT